MGCTCFKKPQNSQNNNIQSNIDKDNTQNLKQYNKIHININNKVNNANLIYESNNVYNPEKQNKYQISQKKDIDLTHTHHQNEKDPTHTHHQNEKDPTHTHHQNEKDPTHTHHSNINDINLNQDPINSYNNLHYNNNNNSNNQSKKVLNLNSNLPLNNSNNTKKVNQNNINDNTNKTHIDKKHYNGNQENIIGEGSFGVVVKETINYKDENGEKKNCSC